LICVVEQLVRTSKGHEGVEWPLGLVFGWLGMSVKSCTLDSDGSLYNIVGGGIIALETFCGEVEDSIVAEKLQELLGWNRR
jgi:hypothetical protein